MDGIHIAFYKVSPDRAPESSGWPGERSTSVTTGGTPWPADSSDSLRCTCRCSSAQLPDPHDSPQHRCTVPAGTDAKDDLARIGCANGEKNAGACEDRLEKNGLVEWA